MLGAIAGDIIGSVYENNPIKTTDFPLFVDESQFTDDTVLTVAVADCVMSGTDYAIKFKEYVKKYPRRGYGQMFLKWAASPEYDPYNSFGNGSAMRVSPIGFAYNSLDEVLIHARQSAEVTHNHPEGIKGAQAVAASIFLARTGVDKADISRYVTDNFGYNLDDSLDNIREWYAFNTTCPGTVPQALIAFLESNTFEDAIRKSISLGGDSDTLACITGGVAQAYYKWIPENIVTKTKSLLDEHLAKTVEEFCSRFYA